MMSISLIDSSSFYSPKLLKELAEDCGEELSICLNPLTGMLMFIG